MSLRIWKKHSGGLSKTIPPVCLFSEGSISDTDNGTQMASSCWATRWSLRALSRAWRTQTMYYSNANSFYGFHVSRQQRSCISTLSIVIVSPQNPWVIQPSTLSVASSPRELPLLQRISNRVPAETRVLGLCHIKPCISITPIPPLVTDLSYSTCAAHYQSLMWHIYHTRVCVYSRLGSGLVKFRRSSCITQTDIDRKHTRT